MKKKFLKISIIVLKIISSLILSFLIFTISIGVCTIANNVINLFTVLILLTILLLFVNWAIWTKGVIKKIVMFFSLLFIFILGIILISDKMGIKSDYCIEDGDCKAGRVIYANGQKILINKENCIKNGFEWFEKGQMCKIDVNKTRFSVEKIIYD